MTGKPTYEELKAVFDSLPTVDAKLAWTETLPDDSSIFIKEPRNPEFAEFERQLMLWGGPSGLRKLSPTAIAVLVRRDDETSSALSPPPDWLEGPSRPGASLLTTPDSALGWGILVNSLGRRTLLREVKPSQLCCFPKTAGPDRERFRDVKPAFKADTCFGFGFAAITETEVRYLAA
jgi:hypothetical protein